MKMAPLSNKSTTICSDLLLFLAFLAETMVQGGAVPALFVFGDSQTDVGSNNDNLVTPFRANFPHNGVDYPGHLATGRFSNGYNLADFMARSLGLATPPAYHTVANTTGNYYIFLNGANFASGGAGVLDVTNKGLTITFGEQIERDYLSVYKRLVQKLGQAQATTHLASSIFTAGIGGNDIATRVLSDPTTTLPISDQQFINSLAKSLKRKLQRMYELGMRKLFLVGTGPLGCYPLLRQRSLVTMECDAEANALSRQYDAAAVTILRDMSTRHLDFQYSFLDQYAALLRYIQEPAANGFAEAKTACCGVGESAALLICMPANTLCANRRSHVFWDGGHLTEITTEKLTGVAFNGSAPLVSPVNLKQLSAAP
ncbi:unnamed protein product [Urochloa humidicola]